MHAYDIHRSLKQIYDWRAKLLFQHMNNVQMKIIYIYENYALIKII